MTINMNMNTIINEMEREQKETATKAQTERTKLAIEMQAAGVNHVTISFSGGGDSGQVDVIKITMADGFTEPCDLHEKLDAFAYKFLEGTGIDWYNNDGGQGEIEFDLTSVPPAFSANVDVNETVSKTALSVERECA